MLKSGEILLPSSDKGMESDDGSGGDFSKIEANLDEGGILFLFRRGIAGMKNEPKN